VNFSSPELSALRADVANLKNHIQELSNGNVSEDGLALLEKKVEKLDAKLSELQRAKRVSRKNTVTAPPVRVSPNR
jgi:hypothetical protein